VCSCVVAVVVGMCSCVVAVVIVVTKKCSKIPNTRFHPHYKLQQMTQKNFTGVVDKDVESTIGTFHKFRSVSAALVGIDIQMTGHDIVQALIVKFLTCFDSTFCSST